MIARLTTNRASEEYCLLPLQAANSEFDQNKRKNFKFCYQAFFSTCKELFIR